MFIWCVWDFVLKISSSSLLQYPLWSTQFHSSLLQTTGPTLVVTRHSTLLKSKGMLIYFSFFLKLLPFKMQTHCWNNVVNQSWFIIEVTKNIIVGSLKWLCLHIFKDNKSSIQIIIHIYCSSEIFFMKYCENGKTFTRNLGGILMLLLEVGSGKLLKINWVWKLIFVQ